MGRKYELRTFHKHGELMVEAPDGKRCPVWKALEDQEIDRYRLRSKELAWLRTEEEIDLQRFRA